MIAKIYKLPSGLTSPDDKPDLQLWNVLTSNTKYYSTIDAQTISAPDLDTIQVQTGGLGDMETQQLYLSNFINVGTFWYQITNISYAQQTANGVYVVEGKLDIYFSFLVSFFDETTTSNSRIYFHQKHINRTIVGTSTSNNITTSQNYLWPSIQQYLLNKHPALKDVGKQLIKTYHILNPNNYPTQELLPTPSATAPITTWNIAVNNNGATSSGTTDGTVNISDLDDSVPYLYTPYNYFSENSGSYAYPVLILKADSKSNIEVSNAGLFPYFLCDWGQQYEYNYTSTLTLSNPNFNYTYTNTSLNYPSTVSHTYKKLFDIASDYYVGLYLFPLPFSMLIPNGNDDVRSIIPISNILNQGVFVNGEAYVPSAPNYAYGTQQGINAIGEDISKQIEAGALCNLSAFYINGNTFYGVSNLTPINKTYLSSNYSVIEPALLNGMSFNVRLYGQDNLVRPLDFNYTLSSVAIDLNTGNMTPTLCESMDALFVYLNCFAITISPPNVMITNIPYHDFNFNIDNANLPNWLPKFGAFNGYNDAIFSAMMKSEVPTPSTAGTNYIANSKNSYDMGLNISNLLAQNAQAQVQIARNNMGAAITNEISGLGGAIGDIFTGNWGALGSAIGGLATGGISIANASIEADTIAPNNADIQQMRYNYMASGKQQDMSRTTSMRVSATATTNTLNDTVYTVIDEVPPDYEQIYIVNYYALNGYIVNKWDLWKYWFNRKICNFVCCSFFTNAMLPNLNINGKARIDKLLNQGFRVGCYNNNIQVQVNPTTTASIDWSTIPYNVVLYNSFDNGDYIYNNTETNSQPTEIYYLMKGTEPSNADIQAGVLNFYKSKENNTH